MSVTFVQHPEKDAPYSCDIIVGKNEQSESRSFKMYLQHGDAYDTVTVVQRGTAGE